MRFVTSMLVVMLLATPLARAAPSGNDLVQASLVSDVSSVKPGQPFTLGVLLKLTPDWHVYWKNPGESGLATKVTWKLPAGFKAGELKFPIPIRFDQAGDIIGYGYKDEVLLTATITPPNNLEPGKVVPIEADVSWLVCEKVCLPGKASVKLDLPAGDGSSANPELFAKWNPWFPRPAAEAKDLIQATGLSPSAKSVFVKWGRPVKDVQWFPVPPESSGVENMQTTAADDVSTFAFDLVPAPRTAAPMSFLVAFTDQDGKWQGVEFTVNLPPASRK